MKHEQVIYGSIPLDEEWRTIPGYNGKYQITKDGKVRAFYRYSAHNLEPHYKRLKGDGGSIYLSSDGHRGKFCIDYLVELCFGIQHVESLPDEIWKPVKGYEGYYKISNKGRLLAERRFLTRKNGVQQFCKEHIVEARTILNSGYYAVNLIKEKKLEHRLIHRLVAEHFIENSMNYEQVNHKDENKLNNVVDNLEWCNRSYNGLYGTCQERRVATRLRNNNGKYGYKRKVNR